MRKVLQVASIDLIVLDAMLPGKDGFTICREIRATGSVPISCSPQSATRPTVSWVSRWARTTTSRNLSIRANCSRGCERYCAERRPKATG